MKRALVVTALLLLNVSQAWAFDVAKEEAALLRRDAEWAELASSGKDVDKIVSYWTDDAILIMSGQVTIKVRPLFETT